METDAPSDDGESEIPMSLCSMASIPDSLLLSIFSNLVAKDVLKASQVCSRWRAVAYDESLWRQLMYRKWNISGKIAPGYCSWRNEYKRLYYYAPLVWSETLTEHSDEVLHVSFAHNGSLFATTSKDCSVKVCMSWCVRTMLFLSCYIYWLVVAHGPMHSAQVTIRWS